MGCAAFLFLGLGGLEQGDACGDGGIQAVEIVVQGYEGDIVAVLGDIRAHPLCFIADDERGAVGPLKIQDVDFTLGV